MKKAPLQKIVFIGAGNVATSLSDILKEKTEIIQVYSKTFAHARRLGQKLRCTYTNDLKKISTGADIYIIAVKDDAIEEISKNIRREGKLVIHTSGSTELNVLKSISKKCGVLWPMHSFAGKAKLAPETPFFIEASGKNIKKELAYLVKIMKGKPYFINSEKRAKVHLAAVFINNFPNHLFVIAETLCKEAGIPFKLFLPLAKETFKNIAEKSPTLSQTGPANRNDKHILNKHLALLKFHPVYKEVYEILTKSIIQTNSGRKKL